MKHLHDLRVPPPSLAYVWYAAMQTRTGARHLLQVPVLTLDLGRLRVPTHLVYSPARADEWRAHLARSGADIAVPLYVNPAVAHQFCNVTQAVENWQHYTPQPNDPTLERYRGFCGTCWRGMQNDPSIATTIRDLMGAQRNWTLIDTEDWRSRVEARVYR